MSTRRRFLHPIWLIVSLPGYIGWRLLPALADGPSGYALGVAVLLAACVIIPLSVAARSFTNHKLADLISWVGLTTLGFFSTLFVMTLLRDVFLLSATLLQPAGGTATLIVPSAKWAVGLTVASTVVGFITARLPRRVDVAVPVVNLPAALEGFSVAQISDLHVGPTIKKGFVEDIVARVNRLGADVIVITGDLVDGSVHDLAPHTAPLAGLKARHGVYFVTGNHEYYSGAAAWVAEVRRLGITVLENQHVLLEHAGAIVLLAGVTDYTAHHFDPARASDPAAALAGSPNTVGAKILLAHQPSSAVAAAAAGYDVQISGHTHGGQFWPWNLFIHYFQPFTEGLNRLDRLQVYVSRGTGYWGPPNRFLVRGEVTRITFVAAQPLVERMEPQIAITSAT